MRDEVGTVRAFTIEEARLRAQETVQYLPVLGQDGYVVRGWTHLLAGFWRLGKTELAAAVIADWLRMGLRVLWITEEPDSLWADRADMFDDVYEATPWPNLGLVDALSASPPALLDYAASRHDDVVVVDTIREVCGIESMKDDEAVHRALRPWMRRLRDGERTLLFLAQHRKAEGEDGSRVLGSVELPAKFDVVLELTKVDERQRKLSVRRRRSQTAPLIYRMDDDERLTFVPDGRQRTRVDNERAAFDIVAASATPLSTRDVRKLMPQPTPSADTVLRALTALADDRRISRDPPITTKAARSTVRWFSAAGKQPELPQELLHPTGEFRAADGLAADSSARDVTAAALYAFPGSRVTQSTKRPTNREETQR